MRCRVEDLLVLYNIGIYISRVGRSQPLSKYRLLPETLARSMSAGIGLFLAFIGYQSSEGIGVVGANGATLVSLGMSRAFYLCCSYKHLPTLCVCPMALWLWFCRPVIMMMTSIYLGVITGDYVGVLRLTTPISISFLHCRLPASRWCF